jgi:predicted  nucleic acid-binding Zn-ribbon protein
MTETTERTILVGETSDGDADGGIEPGQRVELPVEEILTGRAFATGKSGSGKSNTGGVICEQLLENDHPLLVVDIEGEYYSLKEKYEVLHVGADDEVDLRVGPEHAEKLASLALEQRVPIVLDVSGILDEDVRDELVYNVVRQLFAKEKTLRDPFLLVVEEIHEFVPEQGALDDVGQMLVRVAKRGRKRGLGLLGMSQRPANVKKDYITQADWLVWHRLTWSNDTKVVRRVLGSEYEDAVEGLGDGEAFLQADFTEPAVRRVQFRRKDTFDAGATPSLDDVDRPELKSISDDLVDELEEISAAADRREDELARKERRIEDLEAEVEELQEELARARDVSALADRMTDAMSQAGGENGERAVETIKADVMEVREEKRELQDELDDVRAERDRLAERVADLEDELDDREGAEELQALRDDVVELMQRHPDVLDVEAGGRVEKMEREIQELREERDELANQVRDEFGDVDELLAHKTVQDRIEDIADESNYGNTHTWDAVTALAGTEWVAKGAVSPYMDVGDSSTGDVLRELVDAGLVEKRRDGRNVEFRLDRDALESLVDAYRKRERLEAKREELRVGGGSDE